MHQSLLFAALAVLLASPLPYAQASAGGTWPACLPKPRGTFAEHAYGIVLSVKLNEDGDAEIPYHFRVRAIDSNGGVRLDTLIAEFGQGIDKCRTMIKVRDIGPSVTEGVIDLYSTVSVKRHPTYIVEELDAYDRQADMLYNRAVTQNACFPGDEDNEWSFACAAQRRFVNAANPLVLAGKADAQFFTMARSCTSCSSP